MLSFFDCNASFGVSAKPPLHYSADADALIAQMDFCGIDRALVWHASMREGSPVEGNRTLTEALRGRERLIGTWAILPHQTGEQPPPEDFLVQMAANSIRALWAWPSQHRYLLSKGGMGDLLAVIEQRRVPLFMNVEEYYGGTNPGWATVEGILRDFPHLTFCAMPVSDWGQDRCFRPLVEQYERLHVGIESYQLAGGIPDFCHRYGAERLLFGSGHPRVAMGGARTLLERVEISDRDKQAIAGGNLDRLLSEAQL